MDSFELNKIAGAVIGACLLAMVVGKISGGIVHPTAPAKPVFEAADEAPATATAAAIARSRERVSARSRSGTTCRRCGPSPPAPGPA